MMAVEMYVIIPVAVRLANELIRFTCIDHLAKLINQQNLVYSWMAAHKHCTLPSYTIEESVLEGTDNEAELLPQLHLANRY